MRSPVESQDQLRLEHEEEPLQSRDPLMERVAQHLVKLKS